MTEQIEIPDKATWGEKYDAAMRITEQAEADAYFEACVRHTMRMGEKTRREAEKIEKSNFGYWAGYYGSETRERVERLFKTAHPIFGAIAEKGQPSQEEAFEAGKTMAGR